MVVPAVRVVGAEGLVQRVLGVLIGIVVVNGVALGLSVARFLIRRCAAYCEPGEAVELEEAVERKIRFEIMTVIPGVGEAEGAVGSRHEGLATAAFAAPSVGVLALKIERKLLFQFFFALSGFPLMLVAA